LHGKPPTIPNPRVTPPKAGVHLDGLHNPPDRYEALGWMPACAGMTA
jgi:hypothetical protein